MSEQSSGDQIYLKEYVKDMLAFHERELVFRVQAMERALNLAKEELDRRLGELNKLRSEVTEDRENFVMKAMYEVRWGDLSEWRSAISDRVTRIETRGITWMAAIGLFSVLVNIAVSIYFRNK